MTKSPLKVIQEEGLAMAHSWRVQSIMAGEARREEYEAVGYILSTVRKQRDER